VTVDRFGRNIHYLRISLTDRCNLRCVYCMPEHVQFRSREQVLGDEELLRLFRLFVALGFDKFRLTGGEPTMRHNLVELVRTMAHTPYVRELAMTTNGLLLSRMAKPLAEAGLTRVNISVDSLDPARYAALTRRDRLDEVMAGIHAAEEAGLRPIKLNTVVARDFSESSDVIDLARLTLDHDWHVRYIEMMPVGGSADFARAQIVTEAELRDHITAALGRLETVNDGRLDGEARLFRLAGARGTLGFISSVTAPFCAGCSRLRLTADGRIRMCLLREGEIDLLTPLRAGAMDTELTGLIRRAVWIKPWGHGLEHGAIATNLGMHEIGG